MMKSNLYSVHFNLLNFVILAVVQCSAVWKPAVYITNSLQCLTCDILPVVQCIAV
jgi:hypothetical protein